MRRNLLIMGTAWVILGILPATGLAQHAEEPSDCMRNTEVSRPLEDLSASSDRPAPRRVLVPLYVSSAVLQMMDVHSTRRAIALGHAEGNPFMAGIASNTTAFVALKAATAATTILVSEKLRRRNRVAAIGLMIAVNAAAATVVAHNYRVAR
jgi:hypothetical protein